MINVRESAPITGDDWTQAFVDAIAKAEQLGLAGVVVPSDPALYTVRRPTAGQTPSIDLRGLHGLALFGEGARSVISMIGPGAWRLIHIGGEATAS
ncbi:hypothetical protein FHX52_0807 [Humibacillus xanthopallidus]|uniref:Uncharacterized protein n=1 Tax=Humibacillus xanthopallidus TaxID=412689 RepID=A0A543PUE0_9MICO|nr:hypothetical protein [Humibacillus xanthopallidus]TQN47698.1 hypothetical protein FHX52_0807 [Humibacillus xanthopallidus]